MISIMAGFLCMVPASLSAKDFKGSYDPFFPRMPAAHPITISVDEQTGEVTMYFSYAIDDLTISLKQNGVTLAC